RGPGGPDDGGNDGGSRGRDRSNESSDDHDSGIGNDGEATDEEIANELEEFVTIGDSSEIAVASDWTDALSMEEVSATSTPTENNWVEAVEDNPQEDEIGAKDNDIGAGTDDEGNGFNPNDSLNEDDDGGIDLFI
ncbi:MAG: hypothetical protein ACI8P2_004224, partial [Candidatus Latescibacterota bacterium]